MSSLTNQQLVSPPDQQPYFGLLSPTSDGVELHGFEVTMDNEVVIPTLQLRAVSNPTGSLRLVISGTNDVART